jgi:uncharacterized protein (TIGR02145 family)
MVTMNNSTIRTLFLAAAVVAAGLVGCAPDNFGEFTDARDGKRYKTVKMPDGKTWMAENLNYQTADGSRCYSDYESNCGRYGRLYDWKTATTVCPDGWHLSSAEEWDDLWETLDRIFLYRWSGMVLKAKLGWITTKTGDDGNGSDLYGFSALPGGMFCDHKEHRCRFSDSNCPDRDIFREAGEVGNWWTASENSISGLRKEWGWRLSVNASNTYIRAYIRSKRYRDYRAYSRRITNEKYINENYMGVYTDKEHGLSVRCVRDYIDPSELARLAAETEKRQTESERRLREAEERRQKEVEERFARDTGRFTDPRDGRTYRTMIIGGETWMAQNLHYRTPGGSWCYDGKNSNCDIYGRLYDWNAAMTACPSGWHLSTREEWRRLVGTVDGGGKFGPNERAGKILKAKSGWQGRRYTGRDGTDEYGFSALPGGYRDFVNEESPYLCCGENYRAPYFSPFRWIRFRRDNHGGNWWTATEGAYGSAFSRYIRIDRDYVAEFNDDKGYGFSVRCVRDN